MANTYTQLYVQVVIVVQGRQNLITKDFKTELYSYITGIIKKRNHKLIIINGTQDHIHILISCRPDEAISDLVKEIKRSSSIFINEKRFVKGKFSWQNGFAAFSYSKSSISYVIKYIENQEEHHKLKSFTEELKEFFKLFDIDYDEKYLFDEIN